MPSTKPKPRPSTRPAGMSKKNTGEAPDTSTPSGRNAAPQAVRTASKRDRLGVHPAVGELGQHDDQQQWQHHREHPGRVAGVRRVGAGRVGPQQERPAEREHADRTHDGERERRSGAQAPPQPDDDGLASLRRATRSPAIRRWS